MAYPLVVRRTPVGRDREEFPTVGGVCAKWFCSLKQIEREGPSSRHESRGFAKPPSRCCRAGRFCEKPFGFGKLFYAHELWLAPETPFFQPCRETGTTVDAFLVKVPYKYKLSSQNRMGALGGPSAPARGRASTRARPHRPQLNTALQKRARALHSTRAPTCPAVIPVLQYINFQFNSNFAAITCLNNTA